MDNLAAQLVELLRELLAAQERQLALATRRQDAMRSYNLEGLNAVAQRERDEVVTLENLENRRKQLLSRIQATMGRNVKVTTSEIAKRCKEPVKSQLLVVAAELRQAVAKVEAATRSNAKVSSAVVASIAKVLKIVTGVAQHAGLYMRNGRKAVLRGIHALDIAG